ncbi:hypothetical protein EXN66_Car006055 [Channa argus]|uniref:Uncharacterized protein n=1 Tax=Channa argus TaxID=215402 RepID=A0A6G1PJF5_CHAAH|nr:hypothetical protein EXN66_Car006055 [Channa argus]
MVRSRASNSVSIASKAAKTLHLLHKPLSLKEAEEKLNMRHTEQVREGETEGDREAIANG